MSRAAGGRGRFAALAALAATVALLIAGCGLEQDIASKSLNAGPGVGQAAPQLSGALADGSTFDLATQRGRPVVVDFFASWCGPCQKQQAELNAVAHRYAGRIGMVGVDMEESLPAVRGYEGSNQVPYGALIDSDGRIASAYSVPAPPFTAVIDRNGTIVQTFLGGVTLATLTASLDHLLTG